MRRNRSALCVMVALSLALGLLAPLAAAGAAPERAVAAEPASAASSVPAGSPKARRVIVLLAPYLSWSELSSDATPNLWRLARTGAVANMNAQTGDQDDPSAVRGALTLGAGRWAATPRTSPGAYDVDERFETSTAGEAYPRYFGNDAPAGAAIVYLGMPAAQRASAGLVAVPTLGALGERLGDAGMRSGAVGNSDHSADGSKPLRPAALVSMDASGSVDGGSVGAGLLREDATAPYGVRTDSAMLELAATEWLNATGHGMLVIDTGDMLRARDAAWSRTEMAAEQDRSSALRELDTVLGWLLSATTGDDQIVVVSNAVEMQAWNQPHLAPLIIGPGGTQKPAGPQSLLFSPSTHRPGVATNLDFAPTVLDMLSVEATSAMIGAPMRPADDTMPSLEAAIAHFERQNAFALAVDAVRDPVVLGWLWASLAAFVFGAWFVWRRVRHGRAIVRAAVLAVLALPPATWLSTIPERYLATPQAVMVATFAWALVLWAFALLVGRVRRWPEAPAALLTGLTAGLVVVDNLASAPWAESGIFSYSILAGWRYYGVGNEGSALAVAAAIVATGLAVDMARGTRGERAMQLVAMPLVGAVTLFALAAPTLGANAGVAVWGVIAFGAAWVVTAGLRFTWKTVLGAIGAVVAVVLLFSAIDFARGTGGETHLGKLVRSILSGDFGYGVDLVSRKAINAWRYSADTPFTWLAAGCVAILAWLRLDKRDDLDALLARGRGFAAAMTGVLAGAVVALFTEDSGSAMPALMLTVAVASALSLALAPGVGGRDDEVGEDVVPDLDVAGRGGSEPATRSEPASDTTHSASIQTDA